MEGNEVQRAVSGSLPAIVAASELGAEMPVISRERWEAIQRMRVEGRSVSEIARSTRLDRKTVRNCLRKSEWSPYRRRAVAGTLLWAHERWLEQRAPEVNYSARILYQELRASRGYEGGYDTVRNAVRPLRTEAAAAALTQCRFETEPGQQGQVDWGQVRVRFASGPAVVDVFVLTLGYSRRAWAEGYENERLPSLLAAHEHAFQHFGGRPAELLYDRMLRSPPTRARAKRDGTVPSRRSRGTGASSRGCAGPTGRKRRARSSRA
jgi:transposase